MCIVCNCDFSISETYGSDFLSNFNDSQRAMKKAAEGMLICSQNAKNLEIKRRYDRAYKHMVRVMHDWNRTEELREKKC